MGAVLLSFLLVVGFQSSCKECRSHHLLIGRVNKLNQPMRRMLSYGLLGFLSGLLNSRGQIVWFQFEPGSCWSPSIAPKTHNNVFVISKQANVHLKSCKVFKKLKF